MTMLDKKQTFFGGIHLLSILRSPLGFTLGLALFGMMAAPPDYRTPFSNPNRTGNSSSAIAPEATITVHLERARQKLQQNTEASRTVGLVALEIAKQEAGEAGNSQCARQLDIALELFYGGEKGKVNFTDLKKQCFQ